MTEKNALSRNPIYKITQRILRASELDSWRKTGIFGITSQEAVNGSHDFTLEILPSSANGHIIQRQTTNDTTAVQVFERRTGDNDRLGLWTNVTKIMDGTNSVYVMGNGAPDENFIELLNAYEKAISMTPGGDPISETNKVDVFVYPSDYDTERMNVIRISMREFISMNPETNAGISLSFASGNGTMDLYCDYLNMPMEISSLDDLVSIFTFLQDLNSGQTFDEWFTVTHDGTDIILTQNKWCYGELTLMNCNIYDDDDNDLVRNITLDDYERGYLSLVLPYVNVRSITGEADVYIHDVIVDTQNVTIVGLRANGNFTINPDSETGSVFNKCYHDTTIPVFDMSVAVVASDSSIMVNAIGSPTENGAALQAAYDAAKLITPNGAPLSATNRVRLVASPGKYKMFRKAYALVHIAQSVFDNYGVGDTFTLTWDAQIPLNTFIVSKLGYDMTPDLVSAVGIKTSMDSMEDGGRLLADTFDVTVIDDHTLKVEFKDGVYLDDQPFFMELIATVNDDIQAITVELFQEEPMFTMDTQYIDLVSLDNERSVILDGIHIAQSFIFVCGVDTSIYGYPFRVGNGTESIIKNCKGGPKSFCSWHFEEETFDAGVSFKGTYIDCEGTDSFCHISLGGIVSVSGLSITGDAKLYRCKNTGNGFIFLDDASALLDYVYINLEQQFFDCELVNGNGFVNIYINSANITTTMLFERCKNDLGYSFCCINFLTDNTKTVSALLNNIYRDCICDIGFDSVVGVNAPTNGGVISRSKFYNCQVSISNNGFGDCDSNLLLIFNGIASNCIAYGSNSFFAGGEHSGIFMYCKSGGDFPTPTVNGKTILCIDGTGAVITR